MFVNCFLEIFVHHCSFIKAVFFYRFLVDGTLQVFKKIWRHCYLVKMTICGIIGSETSFKGTNSKFGCIPTPFCVCRGTPVGNHCIKASKTLRILREQINLIIHAGNNVMKPRFSTFYVNRV